MRWRLSHRCYAPSRALADRHYNRQHIGADNFVPPGRCLVLHAETPTGQALWVTSWPFAEYTHHAWAGAWVNSLFRNEGAGLSSELIREAVAATVATYGAPPSLGFVTFIDTDKTRRKRDPGRCYRKAGFVLAACPAHSERMEGCAACGSRTKSGLVALQLRPADMPNPELPIGATVRLFGASY